MRPVLVQTALIPEQRVDECAVKRSEPAEEDQQVIPGNDRRRVKLQAAQRADQVMDHIRRHP